VLRPRVIVYGAVLLAICAALATSLALRTPFKVDVVRDRTALARLVEDGRVENVYRLQVMNASEAVQRFRIAVSGLDALAGAQVVGVGEVSVGAAESRWCRWRFRCPRRGPARRRWRASDRIPHRAVGCVARRNRLATQRAVDIRRAALKGAIPP